MPETLCTFNYLMITMITKRDYELLFAAVVQLVSESKTPPVRPRVPDDDADMRYLKLMQSCWDENPLQRHTFEAVKAKLRQIHGGRSVLFIALN